MNIINYTIISALQVQRNLREHSSKCKSWRFASFIIEVSGSNEKKKPETFSGWPTLC